MAGPALYEKVLELDLKKKEEKAANQPNTDTGKKSKYFGRGAHMDAADANIPFEDIDFVLDPNDTSSNTDKIAKAKAGRDVNLMYQAAAHNVRQTYPFANVLPSSQVPMKGPFIEAKKVQATQGTKFTTEALTTRMMIEKHADAQAKAKKREAHMKKGDPQRIADFADSIAGLINDDQAKVLQIAAAIMRTVGNLEKKRKMLGNVFYCPKNMTQMAISSLLADYSLRTRGLIATDAPSFGLPPVRLVREVASRLGYSSIDLFEADVEAAIQVDAMKSFKKMAGGRDAGDHLPHEILDFVAKSQTRAAASDKELFETDPLKIKKTIEYGDALDAQEAVDGYDEDEEVKMFSRIHKARGQKLQLMPFKYGNKFTYKVLYYLYLNHCNYILPFGRTIPNAPWLYLLSYVIDKGNSLRLRMDTNDYLLKLGGIGLLEASNLYNQEIHSTMKKLFGRTTGTGSNMASMKNLATMVLMGFIKVTQKRRRRAELYDSLSAEKAFISKTREEVTSEIDSKGLKNDLLYIREMGDFNKMVDLVLQRQINITELSTMMYSHYGITHNQNRWTAKDIRDVISYPSFLMADTMVRYAKAWDRGEADAKAWYMHGSLLTSQGGGGYFGVIVDALEHDGIYGTAMLMLFRTEERRNLVQRKLAASKVITTANGFSEYIGIMHKLDVNTLPVRIWSEEEQKAVLRTNSGFANLLLQAFQATSDPNVKVESKPEKKIPSSGNHEDIITSEEEEERIIEHSDKEEDNNFTIFEKLLSMNLPEELLTLNTMLNATISEIKSGYDTTMQKLDAARREELPEKVLTKIIEMVKEPLNEVGNVATLLQTNTTGNTSALIGVGKQLVDYLQNDETFDWSELIANMLSTVLADIPKETKNN